jgi:hypothetical protein
MLALIFFYFIVIDSEFWHYSVFFGKFALKKQKHTEKFNFGPLFAPKMKQKM